jgi:transcriptional regulator GlxA family with amidase domain
MKAGLPGSPHPFHSGRANDMRGSKDRRRVRQAAPGRSASAPVRSARDEAIARALKYIEEHPGHTVQLADLCAAARVSERTLRSMFLEVFGVAPNRYLRMRKLHLVRAALAAADPHVDSVAAIAARCGFGDSGRMASDYRALFGEYPNITLSRRLSDGI